MSIKGDMAAILVSRHGVDFEKAVEMVTDVLQAADDPNFAYRFAERMAPEPQTSAMNQYWEVVKFLKDFA